MTEKRFTITQDFEEHHRQIRDNGHIIMGCFVEPQAEVIVDLLNELHEENQQLREIISENRTITIPYTITDEKLVKKLREMFKEDLE